MCDDSPHVPSSSSSHNGRRFQKYSKKLPMTPRSAKQMPTKMLRCSSEVMSNLSSIYHGAPLCCPRVSHRSPTNVKRIRCFFSVDLPSCSRSGLSLDNPWTIDVNGLSIDDLSMFVHCPFIVHRCLWIIHGYSIDIFKVSWTIQRYLWIIHG